MLIALFGIAVGFVIGYLLPLNVPGAYSLYLSVAILAALDTIFGGIRASLEDKFDNTLFISGFITNSLVALGLAYVGDKLGIPLYYAAVFVFGTRLFNNISMIRRYILK